MFFTKVLSVLGLCVFSLFTNAAHTSDILSEISLEDLLNLEVTSSSLTKKSRRFAPNTISYITAEQLEAMGARTLSDVLKTLPGIDIQERRNGRNMVWVRGIPSGRNTKVMLLVDGVPHREPVFGGWSPDEEVPLNNIDHIEVIRGPGSALYGGNAYSGLISIFTKDTVPEKSNISIAAGLFNSQRFTVDTGYRLDDMSLVFSANLFQTNGHNMNRDRRGKATDHNNEVYSYSAHLKFVWNKLRAGINTNHYSTEYPLYSVNQSKPQDYNIISAFIEYDGTINDVDWFNQLYTYQVDRDMNRRRWDDQDVLFFQAFSFLDTQLFGATSRLNFDWDNHDFLLGITAETMKVNKYAEIISLNNYQPSNELQSVLDNNGDSTPKKNNLAVFFQDDIALLDDSLGLTLSLRYDNYQEFDAEISPRIGLVFAPNELWTYKAMWGQAFRPPSNLQQYEVRSDGNSPGNPLVGPEKIKTKEIDISVRITDTQNISTRFFHNSLSDFIQLVNRGPYINVAGKKSVSGAELEYITHFELDPFPASNIQIKANATHLNTTEASVVRNSFMIQGIGNFDWGNMSMTLNYLGKRNTSSTYHTRVTEDDFLSIDNKNPYATVDVNFLIKQPWKLPIEVELSVFNLFDKAAYNPTYAPDSYYDVTREPRFLSLGVRMMF